MVNPLGPGSEDGLTRDEDWGAQLFQAGLEFADNERAIASMTAAQFA